MCQYHPTSPAFKRGQRFSRRKRFSYLNDLGELALPIKLKCVAKLLPRIFLSRNG
jgi:hypothetical protein